MARSHARVQVSIWQDEDFRGLPVGAQRLYLFLMSQGNVTHLGILPMTLQRWAKAATGYEVEALRDDLRHLERAGFVVVDDQSEELLIRSLFRRDGVYKQPNVLRSAVVAARSIYSETLCISLLAEIERIDLSDVSFDKVDLTQQALGDLVSVLTSRLKTPPDRDNRNTEIGVVEPLTEGVGAGVPVPLPYPPTRARACAYPPSPTATPSVIAALQVGRPVDGSRSGEPPGFAQWYAAYPMHKGRKAAAAAFGRALRTTTTDALLAAAQRFADDPTRDPAFTPHPATWLNQGRWEDEGPARPQAVNRSDERTARNLALVDAFARRDHHQPELGA